ncbi:MAG: ABC transporter permease [Syntrophobacterales bacterium]|nr:ABC transporter permease [Syntrophobacterales bacterium]
MILNMLRIAWREIRRNIMRSFLTILGIVIGVAAVVTMVTIGKGATEQVRRQIASMGSNVLIITPGKRFGHGQPFGANIPFKEADAEAIARDITSVAAVAPVSSQALTAVYGNQNWTTQVTGTTNDYFTVTNRRLKRGRLFDETELRNGASVCVIGETVRRMLFGSTDGLGEMIRFQKFSCEVIGILEVKGQTATGIDQDDFVATPLRTYQRRVSGNQNVATIMVSIQDGVPTEKAQSDIARLMRERRRLRPGDEDNFTVMDMKEIAKMLTSTTELLTTLLGSVAAVSLLVGGVGIMNIMLVSVTERTREIGLRLAIGATEEEVLFQFLIEAVVLSAFGGIIGILVAIVASLGLTKMMQVPYEFQLGINVLAFLFSAVIGVIFGFVPARLAAKLNPIEALRHE